MPILFLPLGRRILTDQRIVRDIELSQPWELSVLQLFGQTEEPVTPQTELLQGISQRLEIKLEEVHLLRPRGRQPRTMIAPIPLGLPP